MKCLTLVRDAHRALFQQVYVWEWEWSELRSGQNDQ
jgi:hypothetical protein